MFTRPGLEAILPSAWPGSDMKLVGVTERISTHPGFPGTASVYENLLLRALDLPSLRMLGMMVLSNNAHIYEPHISANMCQTGN